MSAHIIPQSSLIAKSLTPVHARLWQKVTNAPADALNEHGRIRPEYLATAWPGGTDALGWDTLLRTTICRMNRDLAPFGVKLVGARGNGGGGYAVVTTKERAA